MSLLRFGKNNLKELTTGWLPLAAYGLLVLGPILFLVISTFQEVFPNHVDWLSLALPVGRRLGLLLNSLGLALAVSIIGMLIGGLVAVKLWTCQKKSAGLLIWLVLPLAAIPPYIYALSWFTLSDLFGRNIDLSLFTLNRWAGVLWVLVAAYSPITLGCTWIGLRMIDPDLIEVGRTSRSDVSVLARIVLPLCTPALLTGGGIVFLLSLLDYSVPSLLGLHVYAMEIFAEFSASNSPPRAFLISIPLMLVAIAVVLYLLEPLRTLTMRAVRYRPTQGIALQFPGWLSGLMWCAVGMFIILAGSPFVAMIARSGGLGNIALTTGLALEEFRYSFWMAGVAALLCIPLAMLAKRALESPVRAVKTGWMLVILPLAIPASLLGIGMVLISNKLPLRFDALTFTMPAAVVVIRFVPLVVLIILAQSRRSDPLLQDAALVFQPSWWRRQIQVATPLHAPGILAGAGVVFALSMGELGATLMVIPPGKATLTMRIYNYLHYGASDTVAGLCLVLALGVLLAGVLAGLVILMWSRLFAAPEVKP